MAAAVSEKGALQASITLPVLGMSCAACQAHVERALKQTPGVSLAEVNLLNHTARVSFDPALAAPEILVQAIKSSGYEASLPSEGQGNHASHMEHADSSEARVRTGALLTLVMAALAMVLSMPLMHSTGTHSGFFTGLLHPSVPMLDDLPRRPVEFVLLAMTLAGMSLAISEVYQPAWNAALRRATNMNTLVALGTIAALFYSAVATFAPALFASHGLEPGVYYESVLFILAFLMLGRWLEARAKRRTQGALHAFVKLQPETARILQSGNEVDVPLASVKSNDTLVLRPGERVPVDGVVLAGTSSIDESLLTGESMPVPRGPGDVLIGGSLNHEGALEYRATTVGKDSVLGQMLRLMQQAQSSRAPTQQLADRVSAVFVPVVLGLALATLLTWLAFDHGNLSRAFAAAITVLVISCPCAMGLAVPAALTVAIGRGAQLGILVKSGEALERLAHIDAVVIDKTGTLTTGRPQITKVHVAENIAERELLLMAASLEHRSEHPLARAVIDHAAASGLTLQPATSLRAIPGKGLTGIVDDHLVAAGNARLFEELGIEFPPLPSNAAASSVLLVAVDGQYRGRLLAEDQARTGAAEAVAQLHKRGLRTIMLTGDNLAAASFIAKQTGIDEFHAELLPEQKLAHIKQLQSAGRKVAMVGDGINDAAAMSQADAGIAMGTGTDLAREAGDAVLLRGEPRSIVVTLDLAQATLRTMRANLGWAVGYNLLGIPIAAGVLYPLLGILLSPAIASAAMALSSLSVLANSLRLRRFQSR